MMTKRQSTKANLNILPVCEIKQLDLILLGISGFDELVTFSRTEKNFAWMRYSGKWCYCLFAVSKLRANDECY